METTDTRPATLAKAPSQSGHKKFYIPSLDGLRAVALLIVLTAHIGLGNYVPGGFGVTVFFFLSGYLITTLLQREYKQAGRIDLKKFYMRRIVRIWPAFYVVLFWGLGISYWVMPESATNAQTLQAAAAQFLHLANYYLTLFGNEGIALGSNVYWSLAVEEHFYLFFPLLYVLLLRSGVNNRKQCLLFWGICLLVLLWRCFLVFSMGVESDRLYYGTDTRIDSILFGCALAVYGNPMTDYQQQISARALKYFLLPLGIALILSSFVYRPVWFRDTLRYSIQGIALYPIFIAAIRFPSWGAFSVLNLNWVRFMGLLSYSLYLVHLTVIEALRLIFPELGFLMQALIALPVSLACAYALYRFIERPAGKFKKRFAVSR